MAEVARSFRWFPYTVADGPHNMAADEVLLEHAVATGIASLRFYGWSEATLSLGYFQSADVRQRQTSWARLPCVRRPSGGKALVHHHELTYALALPPGCRNDWLPRMHRAILLPALARLGLRGQMHVVEREPVRRDSILCFQEQTPGDLVCAGHKVVGSAQRKHRQCLLQHGAILLRQSEHAPELPGIKELSGVDLIAEELQDVLLSEFQSQTQWLADQANWTVAEREALSLLAHNKYAAAGWTEKR